MKDIERVSARETHNKVTTEGALLVCAYDSDEKFRRVALTGAISLADFESITPALSTDQEIIFYCA